MRDASTRFIGGPLHGKLMMLEPGHRRGYRVPVFDDYTIWHKADTTAPVSSRIREPEYQERDVCFDRSCRIRVMAPVNMGTDEFYRRLADFIEGCSDGR